MTVLSIKEEETCRILKELDKVVTSFRMNFKLKKSVEPLNEEA